MILRWSRNASGTTLHLVRYDVSGIPVGKALCGRDGGWRVEIVAPLYLRCKTCDRLKARGQSS